MENNMYEIQVHDNLVPKDLQKQVFDYLHDQTWHVYWNPRPATEGHIARFKPRDPLKRWQFVKPAFNGAAFQRCCIAVDEAGMKEKHPLIGTVWDTINSALGNQYEITGNPEDMHDGKWAKANGDEQGRFRVYVNGTTGLINTGTWGPHRDTPLENNDETSVTMVYCVNPEWYPRWSGEFVFFPEDPEGLTGDHQQFNTGHQQKRGYNTGWPDQGRMVSPVPGRVLIYDGRCLHNTQSPVTPGVDVSFWRIIFRARRKTNV
jgi:hypothetical protein